jgi:hypothetical protein
MHPIIAPTIIFHMHPIYTQWHCGDTTGIRATNPKDINCPKCLARMYPVTTQEVTK